MTESSSINAPTSKSDKQAGALAHSNYLFTGLRASLFKEALAEYPNTRRDDLGLMRHHLDPRSGERVLGFGEGSGFFCKAIAEAVGPTGTYLITEPSPELICNLPKSVTDLPQVKLEITPVERLSFGPDSFEAGSFDKAWACGAFHHCPDQTRAIAQIYKALRPGGKMVVFDIFTGTAMARHFDECVARYCETGHEVKFMSEEFARTLCYLTGFDDSKVSITTIPHRLVFASEWDMGKFIYKVHAMTRMEGTEEQRIAKTIEHLKACLPIDYEPDQVVLHFDQKGLIAVK